MLLLGSYGKNRDLITELYPLICSNCSRLTPHGLIREQKKARLYGVPVAKWGTAHQTLCGVCNHLSPVGDELAEMYVAVHLRGEPVSTGRLDAILTSAGGADEVDAAWQGARATLMDNHLHIINPNLIETDEQADLYAAFAAAHLAADSLGVHPYEAYGHYLFRGEAE